MLSRVLSRGSSAVRMSFKPMTRTFATRFYDSPLYKALQGEYENAAQTEEKDVSASLEKLTKQFNKMGWEVANEFGSSVVALSKPISDDEDVFVSFKADMQSDITIPEDRDSSDAELQFKVFQNIGTHTSEVAHNPNQSGEEAEADDSYGIDLQMIFVCNTSNDKPLEVVHMDSAVGMESDGSDLQVAEDRYPGPPYEEWDESIKKNVVDHLKDLGITENFSKLLRQFALDKEYSEYINFLRNIAIVPEDEEPDTEVAK